MPTLNWLNKDKATQTAAACAYRLLTEVPDLSCGDKDSGNLIVQGDNLQALKALIPHYAGQVKCIFIDPPYNTGNAFEHYDDNLEHSIWLSLIYPRLELLREFLNENGFIAVQIDDKQYARLYLIMCELFGEKNLKTICVKMSEPTGVKMASINRTKSIAKLKEYIILAGKKGIQGLDLEKVPKESWDYEYKTVVLGLSKEELSFIKDTLDDENRTEQNIKIAEELSAKIEYQPAKEVCFQEGNKKLTEDWLFNNAWRIVQFATLTGGARDLAAEKKLQFDEPPSSFIITTRQSKAYLIRGNFNHETKLPRCKLLFADKYLTVHLGDFWGDIKTTGLDNEGNVDFKNGKKPEKLVKRIIEMSTSQGDLVLDSFLGSGTTAAVAHKMGRRYIGVEIGEHAVTHCVPRLQAVIDGEQGGISKALNWQGGGGFRFCRLGDTVFDRYGGISPTIRFPQLAAHIWYLETKQPLDGTADNPLLGEFGERVYYLLFNGILGDRRPNGGNVLTNKILPELPDFDSNRQQGKQIIIYGESCRLGDARLQALNVTFKQIPYDVGGR